MYSFGVKNKYCRFVCFWCLSAFLLINLSVINLCRGEQPEENEQIIKEKRQVLNKEEATFQALMKCLNNISETQGDKDDGKLYGVYSRNRGRYPRAESLPVNMRLKHAEQKKAGK